MITLGKACVHRINGLDAVSYEFDVETQTYVVLLESGEVVHLSIESVNRLNDSNNKWAVVEAVQ